MNFITRSAILAGVLSIAASPATAQAPETKTIVLDENSLVLSGEISTASVAPLLTKIFAYDKKEMVMYINSPGGSIDAGAQLIQAMNASKKTFTCVAENAVSMAFVTFQLGCQKRVVLENSTLMQHQASYSLDAAPARNQHNLVEYIEKTVGKLEARQAARLGLSKEDFQAKTAHDWWMDADSALTNKAADEYGAVTCNTRLVKGTHIEERRFFIFSVRLKVSDCPLIQNAEVVQEKEPESSDKKN